MSPPPCVVKENCHDPLPCPLRKAIISRRARLVLITPYSLP